MTTRTGRSLRLIVVSFVVLAIAIPAIWLVRFLTASNEVASRDLSDTTADAGLPREAGGHTADLLSAFHGLDALPAVAHLICRGGAGKTGMPVIFSTEIDLTTLQAGDFQVTTASGQVGAMHCVSLMPAIDPGELRTALLIGDLGGAATDPPVSVEITGHLHSVDGTRDFRGARIAVTPLEAGPSLVLAQVVEDWTVTGTLGPDLVRGTRCPGEGVAQAVRVTWEGGVSLPEGGDPGAAERDLYKVTVEAADGARREVTPVALADLADFDNNHMLCLNTADRPVSVSFPAGVLVDPNKDLNPATSVDVTPSR